MATLPCFPFRAVVTYLLQIYMRVQRRPHIPSKNKRFVSPHGVLPARPGHPISSVPASVPVSSAHFPLGNDYHYAKKNGSFRAASPQMKGCGTQDIIKILNLAASLQSWLQASLRMLNPFAPACPWMPSAPLPRGRVPSSWEHQEGLNGKCFAWTGDATPARA